MVISERRISDQKLEVGADSAAAASTGLAPAADAVQPAEKIVDASSTQHLIIARMAMTLTI